MYNPWCNCLKNEILLGNVRVKFLLFLISLVGLGFGKSATSVSLSIAQDSIQVGEPFEATLEVYHQLGEVVVFPDSLSDFKGFEFVSKKWEPTLLTDSGIVDKAIYQLSTYELDTIQYLSLPVVELVRKDSMKRYSNFDSVRIHFELDSLPMTIIMKEDTSFVRPELPVFKITVIFGVIVGFIYILGSWLWFGKVWVARVKTLLIKRKLKRFDKSFVDLKHKVEQDLKSKNELVVFWKKYCNTVSDFAFRSLTTQDILKLYDDEELSIALHHFDSTVYGNKPMMNFEVQSEKLKEFAHKLTLERIKKIKEDAKRS